MIMAKIFSQKSYLMKQPKRFPQIWNALKSIYFQIHSINSEFEELEEGVCDIQAKPKMKDYSVSAPSPSDGNKIVIKCGKMAKLADGCATVSLNDTTVMATAVSKCKSSSSGFVPLTVSYQQKAAALGRIPMNFLRREYGQNESEILTSRVIDRSIRPLFPEKFSWETQVICNPLAMDGNTFPDVLAINAASAALAISDIPWNGPVGAVRVGLLDGNVIVNPNKKELSKSSANVIIVSKSKSYAVMVEGSFSNALLQDVLKIIKAGVKECQNIIKAIDELRGKYGKEKRVFVAPEINEELLYEIKSMATPLLKKIFENHSHDKMSRDGAVDEVYNLVLEKIQLQFSNTTSASEVFSKVCKNIFRDLIFEQGVRCDGRSLNTLRNIHCEVDLYKPLHGSALFQRGQTQVLCTVALDSPNSALRMDKTTMLSSGIKEKNFFVHYEFPPYATKEVGRFGMIGRREIGHGALAEKALRANIPEDFPFAIRLTSEVLESNGSSSMATVCGGSLALLDAGVPMKNICAGVAMGVVTRWSDSEPSEVDDYRVLTDLLGIEDYFGDMDMKVAGTKKHITAIQLDMKTNGLPVKIIFEGIQQAKSAISTILKEMCSVCSQPRATEKTNWPVREKISVPMHQRAKFIGPSGINIKKLELNAGVEIEEENAGEFQVFAPNKAAMAEVMEVIDQLLESQKEPILEFGAVYTATIVEIREHGCMVTLYPNMQPVLIHMSQLDHKKVMHPSALGMEVGQEIQVKYFGRDPVSGLMRLSRKVLQSTGPQVVQSHFKKFSQKQDETNESSTGVH